MTKLSTILATSAMLGLAASTAFAAGVTKTWVSSTTGNDTGTCQFTSLCKTFAFAITQTLAGGELDVKDSGSYGPVTITQAISIVNDGFLAQISVPSGGVGVTVAAGSDAKVILQGLVIDGHGVGKDGVDFNSGASLTVEDCFVRNINTDGIGVYTGYNTSFEIIRTEVANAQRDGVDVSGGATIGIMSKIDSHNNFTGIFVGSGQVNILRSTINNNTHGIINNNNDGSATISQTEIAGNTSDGVAIYNGSVYSYGDNEINGNPTEISGTLTAVTKK